MKTIRKVKKDKKLNLVDYLTNRLLFIEFGMSFGVGYDLDIFKILF